MAAPFTLLVLCWALRLSCSVHGSPEWFQNLSTSLFSLPGDIVLGGLFTINELSSNLSKRREPDDISCESLNEQGLGLALVMKYAVDEINGNQSLLPGIKLGYKIYDTCAQSAIIVKPTLSFLTAKPNETLSVKCNYTDYETSISAVIGPLTSEMVSVIGKLLGFFLMPQISYGATSDKFSDNLLYPSFFRTVPSDKWQVDVMALLLKEFKWNWVAVVGSEEEYGQQGVQQFSKIAENMSICVAYQGLIPVYNDPQPAIKTIIDNIQATKVGVVVVFALVESAEAFFKEVIRRNVTGVWIASTSWAINNLLTSLPNIQNIGTIIGFIDDTEPLELLADYTKELFKKLSKERERTSHPAPESGKPDNPCPQCWNLSPANITLVTNPAVSRTAFSVYAAVYSVAQALHNLLKCNSAAYDIECRKCPQGEWSQNRSTSCTKPTFDILSWETPESLEMTLAGVVLLLCQGLVCVVFLKHRGTPLVMASGGALSFVALLGLMGACLSLLLFLGQPGDVACRLQLPFTSIFQTVTLSIITSISLEILYVTEFPETAASHLHILRGPGSWLFVLACCAVQAGLCGWFVQEGPSLSQYMADMKITFVRDFLACPVTPLIGFALMQGFNGLMALISFMCTFMAVKPLHQYNLARDITFSSLIYCVIWVTFIPIYIGLKEKKKDQSIVHISFSLASNLGLVAAYYFPKCYLLLRKPDLNIPEHFCTFLEGAPPRPAEEEPQPQPQSKSEQ
ncbi:taste receptor type 1 member 3 [Lates japonicus]|uniref:Taste receptor type 1 member 3 n=1 Tax=Lates japonicus TaxID=270547 RepID=A0AAD3MYL6_LATJO|nr:taste receptor type 1 member 3 [Lates japonicus]